MQCGVDGLAGDPLIGSGELSNSKPSNDGWNLDIESITEAILFVKSFGKPLMILGDCY